MKKIIASTLVGFLAVALPAVANETSKAVVVAEVGPHAALLKQVSQDVASAPIQAGEIVKNAIIRSKADIVLVTQIVRVAVSVAPEQAENILKHALAVAPDAKKEVEIIIAAVLQGDEVAALNSDAANKARDGKRDASFQPEGVRIEDNVVWLDNFGALREGKLGSNPLNSWTQNTGASPNAFHNAGGVIEGGTTIIVRPGVTTSTQ